MSRKISGESIDFVISYFDRDLGKTIVKRVKYLYFWIDPRTGGRWYKLRIEGKEYEFLEEVEEEEPEEYEEEIKAELTLIDDKLLILNIY